METRAAYTIEKPSFWRNRRELKDASHGKAGYLEVTSVWTNAGEGEVQGRKYRFAPKSVWSMYNAEMTDASGQKIASAEPKKWWGMQFTFAYGGVEYEWKAETWHSGFSLRRGDTEIARVRLGGYFKPGTVTISGGDAKDIMPLILFGIYYLQLYANQTAAASGGVYS